MAAPTSVSLYTLTVPTFINGLRNLSHVLTVAEKHAASTNTPPEELLSARLIGDMAALPFQIQRVSDYAKLCVQRVGQTAAAPMADTETTFADLHARIAATIAYLEAVDEPAFAAGAARTGPTVALRLPGGEATLDTVDYVLRYALPQFWFHVSIAYGILRMKGVPIGKQDFVNGDGSLVKS
jgi:uncharacterized protein